MGGQLLSSRVLFSQVPFTRATLKTPNGILLSSNNMELLIYYNPYLE